MRFLLMIAMLFSCTYRPTIMHSDGLEALVAKCDTTKVKCYRDMTKYCPKGYSVIEENEMAHAGRMSANTLVGMVYRCKEVAASPSPMP